MGCGCNGGRSTTWTYVAANGVRTTYATEIEAKAAQVRAGGAGQVQPG